VALPSKVLSTPNSKYIFLKGALFLGDVLKPVFATLVEKTKPL